MLTFGCAGSNHALATTIYARQVGLKSISMLMPQPNALYVRRNLLLSYHHGAELHLCGAELECRRTRPLVYLATLREILRRRAKSGRVPRLIPPGGTSIAGVAGYVNAAFELKRQIADGELPEPGLIYVACGSMGTVAGLLLGLKAASLNSRVVSVLVTSGKIVSSSGMSRLVNRTSAFLHSLDDSFPTFDCPPESINMRRDYLANDTHSSRGRGWRQCL